MDIGKAIGFVFEDEEWIAKLLVGAALMLVPIFGGFALMGYTIAVIRNVLAGAARPLPNWDELGQKFVDGLLLWVVNMIYTLPIWLVACLFVLPILLPLLGGENQDLTTALAGVSTVVAAGLGCVLTLYGLLIWFLTPVIQLQYAVHGEIGACLRLGEVFRLAFDHIGSMLIALGTTLVVGLLIGLVVALVGAVVGTIPICGWIVGGLLGLLVLPLSVWLSVITGHLFGQVGRVAELPYPTL